MDFSEIYNQNYEQIMRISFRITGSLAVAEDLCQDVFVKYLEKFGPETRDNIRFYLIRMIKNISYNHEYRKRNEERILKLYRASNKTEQKEDSLSEIVKNEEISDIQKELLLIPYKYRFPLILREYEGISYKEISKIVKKSESNVKVMIHRAKKILRDKLKETNYGYPS